MAQKLLHKTGEAIDALGGTKGIQGLLLRARPAKPVKPSAISNWRTLGAFPFWTYVPITGALAPLGYYVPPSLFGGLTERARKRRKKSRARKKDEPREGARSSV
jgi:hypothetical protein